ncbi:MAG: hypothetical protein WC595_06840, partial [Candidatus Nanoarchaeia archaeon]
KRLQERIKRYEGAGKDLMAGFLEGFNPLYKEGNFFIVSYPWQEDLEVTREVVIGLMGLEVMKR